MKVPQQAEELEMGAKLKQSPKLQVVVAYTEAQNAVDRLRRFFTILLTSPPREGQDMTEEKMRKDEQNTGQGGRYA